MAKIPANTMTQPTSAAEIATDTNIATISDIIKQVGTTMDTAQASVAVALLNTFILAVDKIGGRRTFTTRDFMAYGMALTALQQIAPHETDYSSGRADLAGLNAIERELSR